MGRGRELSSEGRPQATLYSLGRQPLPTTAPSRMYRRKKVNCRWNLEGALPWEAEFLRTTGVRREPVVGSGVLQTTGGGCRPNCRPREYRVGFSPLPTTGAPLDDRLRSLSSEGLSWEGIRVEPESSSDLARAKNGRVAVAPPASQRAIHPHRTSTDQEAVSGPAHRPGRGVAGLSCAFSLVRLANRS